MIRELGNEYLFPCNTRQKWKPLQTWEEIVVVCPVLYSKVLQGSRGREWGWPVCCGNAGSLLLCPTWCPDASRKAPMDAARPTQTVDTFGRMCRIVSKTAIPAQRQQISHGD